ncbi:phenoloxidase-activating factor 2 isoform X2 [Cryptotermes secundus]|nr:phenoloxidase-activating factor 2 isoform X2 [Cryptotermes secundus]XP_033606086.1 phenoloxidase-activating factor 2 isoform X2 [Cryptotermes secundus]
MAHDHVVFTEESAATTFTSQEMERFHRTSRKRSHNINDRSGRGTNSCGCVSTISCQPLPATDGSGVIDIRIVTTPPAGVTCTHPLVYCCYTSQPHTYVCGTRTPMRLANVKLKTGQAPFAAFPWSAIILGPENNYIGGGILVGSYHVLTAAHKIASYVNCPGVKVRLGDWDITRNIEPYSYQDYIISNVYIHPHFNSANLQNDIAVIKLYQQIPLGVYPNINPACLSRQNAAFTGQRCIVAGWGTDAFGPSGQYQSIEKEATVPVLGWSDCQAKLQATRLGSQFQFNPNSFICAGGEEGYDACTGDGGSALVCEVNGQHYVAGIVAWGIGCADKGVPGVYVNVPSYIDWINQKISQT